MKLIVGLGNPGLQYQNTRHNAGFMVIDRLADRHAQGASAKSKFNAAILDARIDNEKCALVKPTAYMNRSGDPIAQLINFYKLDPTTDLLVIVDDVALPCGSIRLRASGGAGGHNGLSDIQRALSGQQWARLRVGVDPVPPMMDMADYVLGKFTAEQTQRTEPALVRAADAAACWANQGVDAAMNTFNTSPEQPGADDTSASAVHPEWLSKKDNT